jgi:hypothetical protein
MIHSFTAHPACAPDNYRDGLAGALVHSLGKKKVNIKNLAQADLQSAD